MEFLNRMSRQPEKPFHVPPYQIVSSTDLHILKGRVEALIKEGYVLYQAPSMIVDGKGMINYCQAMALPTVKSLSQEVTLAEGSRFFYDLMESSDG